MNSTYGCFSGKVNTREFFAGCNMRLAKMAVLCLTFLLVSSCKDDMSEVPEPREYLIGSYEIHKVQYSEPIDEAYPAATIEQPQKKQALPITNETVAWSNFSMQILSVIPYHQVGDKHLPSVSLFAKAIASSPGLPTAKQHVKELSITSDNSYTDAYPAGAELSSVVGLIHNYFYESFNNNYYVANDRDFRTIKTMADFAGKNIGAPPFFNTRLLFAPQYSRQNFTIKIILDDGSRFDLRSGDIYFTVSI